MPNWWEQSPYAAPRLPQPWEQPQPPAQPTGLASFYPPSPQPTRSLPSPPQATGLAGMTPPHDRQPSTYSGLPSLEEARRFVSSLPPMVDAPAQSGLPKPPAQQPSTLSDVGNLLKSGYASTAQGINWLAGKLPGLNQLVDANSGQQYWGDIAQQAHQNLSQAQQAAGEKKFLNDDGSLGSAWSDPRAYLGSVVESIPGTVMGMGLGGPVTAGLQRVGLAALPRLGAVGAERLAMGAGAIGYGAGEGLTAAGADAVQARDTVLQMPHEELQKVSPQYRDLIDQKMAPDQARAKLAEDTANQVGLQAGLTVAATGAPMGAAFGKLFHGAGKLTNSRLGSLGVGVAGEAGQEVVQSGAEQFLQNKAIQENVNPSQSLWQGVLNQAISGGIAGGIMGGAMAGGGHGSQTTNTARDAAQATEAALGTADQARTDLLNANDQVLAQSIASLNALQQKKLPQSQQERVASVLGDLQGEVERRAQRSAPTETGQPGLEGSFDPSLGLANAPRVTDAQAADQQRLDELGQWQREGLQREIRRINEAAVRREETKRLEAARNGQSQPGPQEAIEPQPAQAQPLADAPSAQPSAPASRAEQKQALASEVDALNQPSPKPGQPIQLERGQSIELSPLLGQESARPTVTAEEQARLAEKMGPRPARDTASPTQPIQSTEALLNGQQQISQAAQSANPSRPEPTIRQEIGRGEDRNPQPASITGQTSLDPQSGSGAVTETAPHTLDQLQTQELPLDRLTLSEDVPQFKSGANQKTGVVEPLDGKYERTGTAPIVVWERADGRQEVISGRHRLDLARRSGEQTIPAQILKESDGFSADKAAMLDAELNIRDGQGKVKDYVQYFQGNGISQTEAQSRGLLARATGARAYGIAHGGTESLIAAHRADQLNDDAAYRISTAAPGNQRLQAVGIKAVADGKSATHAVNLMQAVGSLAAERGAVDSTGDLFGFDDSAIKEAEQMAAVATRQQRQISERLAAVQGAAKRPELARQEGVNVNDPATLRAKIAQLQQEREAWNNWATNPDLAARVREQIAPKHPIITASAREQAAQKPSLLQSYSQTDLSTEQARQKKATAEQAKKDKAFDQKVAADRAAKNFVLTGSNRPADVAMAAGQEGLRFSRPNQPRTDAEKLDALLTAVPVRITLQPDWLGKHGKALRDAADALYRALQPATNQTDGKTVRFVRKAFKEMRQHSADERVMQIVPALRTLFERATPLWVEVDDGTHGRVKAWHNYGVRASIDGKDAVVRLVARELEDGTLELLHHDADVRDTAEIKNAMTGFAERSQQPKPGGQQNESSRKDRLIQWLENSHQSQPKLSRADGTTATPLTATQARTQLVKALGEKAIVNLERAGRLTIHASDPTKTGAAGFVDGQGVIHLVAANVEGDALSVALHEALHVAKDTRFAEGDRAHLQLAHAALRLFGLKNFIGSPSFTALVQQAYRLAAEGNETAQKALAKAKAEWAADHRVNVPEEFVAYLAQYADPKLPLVRRILGAIRAAMFRMGIKVSLTPADVRALAMSALKSQASAAGKAAVAQRRQAAAFSMTEFAPTDEDRAEVERQMAAVKEVRDDQGRLLAPNGKPSKLGERQWKAVRAEFFKKWFGDWENDAANASQVIDENGEPLVVYHGTNVDFNVFEKAKQGQTDSGWYGKGFYFTPHTYWRFAEDAVQARGGAAQIMPVFLNIRSPLYGSAYAEQGSNLSGVARERERDGVIVRFDPGHEQEYEIAEILVLEPTQIKSAIGNVGTFSPRSPRIDYSQSDHPAPLTPQQQFEYAAAGLKVLANNPDLFQYPKSAQKDMAAIAADLSPEIKVSRPDASRQNPLRANRSFGQSWTITMPDGNTADILTSKSGREVYIDASGLEKGQSRGSLLYQLVGQWAYNNGKVFVGDPEGISPAGKARRLEHLISLALKFGTTDHFMPHPDQNIPWRVGDHGYNLAQMLKASSDFIHALVPKLKEIRYDFGPGTGVGGSFKSTADGRVVGDANFKVLANSPGAGAAQAGATTLKRSVLVHSLVQGAGREVWRPILGELARLGSAERLDGSLEKLFYSQPPTSADTAEQERLWQEFQAVQAQFQTRLANTTAFERWFGQGAEGITAKDGKPLTLYHGTPNAFYQFDAARAGQNSKHPSSGLGFFMTADKGTATRYGGNVLELHAKIDKPYFLTDADLMGIDSVEAANRLRTKLKADGYDGAVLSAPGMAPYVIAFQSNQVKLTSNQNPTESPDFRFSRTAPRYDSAELPADKNDAHAYRMAALREVQNRYAGKSPVRVTIESTGEAVTVAFAGVKHALRAVRPSWQASVAALHVEDLLRRAEKIGVEPDRYGRKDPIAIHRYRTQAVFDGVTHETILIVREHSDGRRYYDHIVIDEKASAGLPESQRSKPTDLLGLNAEAKQSISPSGSDLKNGPSEGSEVAGESGTLRDTAGHPPATTSPNESIGNSNAESQADGNRYSRPGRPESWNQNLPQAVKDMAAKIGAEPKPLTERVAEMKGTLATRLRQGLVDRFARLADLDRQRFGTDFVDTDTALSAWVAAKMSKSPEGALEAAFLHGELKWEDGALNVKETNKGLVKALEPVAQAGELNRFWQWIIANRAERLKSEGREHLFTDAEIAAGKALNQGSMADGKARSAIYQQTFNRYRAIQKSILDLAQEAGLFNPQQRAQWEHDFYLPFYRVIEDEGEVRGPSAGGKLVRQKAFEKLKGGTEKLGDPLQNILKNWFHLIDASVKNRAASLALDTAAHLGIAQQVHEALTDKTSVWVMKDGQKVHYNVADPLTLEAISAISAPSLSGWAIKALAATKRALTLGTTISPAFKARNLLRDSIAALAVSQLSPNAFGNIASGYQAAKEGSATQAALLAGGGIFRFGTLLEGDRDAAAKRIAGFKPDTVLDSREKIQGVFDLMKSGLEKWNRFGDQLESANRAALYEQLRSKKGGQKTHLQAALAARDLMDFAQSGGWGATRFLITAVPFLNARIQGLDVLYRKGFKPLGKSLAGKGSVAEKQQATRFALTTFMVSLASVALYLTFKDDKDFKEREQWDRDMYWWFKIPGVDQPFRIPKPFEVGALGTIAERIAEQLCDPEAGGKLFAERMGAMLTQTFAFDPTPQLFKPLLDVAANKDSFTQRPIETLDMERLSPELRKRANTSALATGLSQAGLGKLGLSPVQIEHLTRGYFGWIGAQAMLLGDMAARPALGLPSKPEKLKDSPIFGDLLNTFAPDGRGSRYVTEFYTQLQEIRQIHADAKLMQKLGDTGLSGFVQAHRKELALAQPMEQAARTMAELGKAERRIAENRTLTGEEKQARIDQISERKAAMAQRLRAMAQ